MAISTIPQAYIDQFSADARFVYQQTKSKLRDKVMHDALAAQYGYFQYFGQASVIQRTQAFAEVPAQNLSNYTRRCAMTDWIAPYYVDKFEQKRSNIEFSAATARAVAMAQARQFDYQIIQAALGTAYQGRGTATAITLPSSQVLANNYSDQGAVTSTNMTLDKIRGAIDILRGAEAVEDPDDNNMITCVYTSKQEHSLLKNLSNTGLSTLASSVIETGQLKSYGVNLVRVNSSLLPLATSGPYSGYRPILFFVKDAINYCESEIGMQVEINYIPDRVSWLINGILQGDATRMRENGVVVAYADESTF
jgi:hypothetical protein